MKKVLLFVLSVIVLVGCQSNSANIISNDDIKDKVNEQYEAVMSALKEAVANEDAEKFINLCYPGTEQLNAVYFEQFKKDEVFYTEFFENKLSFANKYYVKDINRAGETADYSTEGYEFVIPNAEYQSGSRYVALVEGTYSNFDLMLTIILSEYEGELKLERFTLGNIRPMSETIDSLLIKAEQQENEGNFISAWQFNEMASQFVNPSAFVHFIDSNKITENMTRLAQELEGKIEFPMDIDVQGEALKIYAIATNMGEDGYYCRIIYVSQLADDSDEESVKEEAKKLHEEASKLIQGIGEGFDGNILYTAYFEEPEEQGKEYKTITVDLKE